jgi:hypothetical protein
VRVCALGAFVLSDQSDIYRASPPRWGNVKVIVICVAPHRDTVLDACCEAGPCIRVCISVFTKVLSYLADEHVYKFGLMKRRVSGCGIIALSVGS